MRGLIIVLSFCFSITSYALTCDSLFSQSQKRSYHNSKYELLNALEVISSEYAFDRAELGRKLYEIKGNTVFVNSLLPSSFPVKLLALHYSILKATENIGLTQIHGEHFAGVALRESARALGFSWSTLLKDIEAVNFPLKYQFRKNLLEALDQLIKLTEVDLSYEIPYLAGYSANNPRKIFIDNRFRRIRNISGKNIDLVPFLVVHERVEKALLDTLPIQKDRYLVSHQIAQRIEKAIVEASRMNWDIYQNQIMMDEIARAGNPHRTLKRSPKELDLTPYKDAKDKAALEKLRLSAQTEVSNNLFDIKIIRPGVIHLSFPNQAQMAWTMMRFQEFYESPQFRGKIFSRKQFLSWFRKKDSGYESYSEWDGFNIPNEILKPFYEGSFHPLTRHEKFLLEKLKSFSHTKFYIVATAGKDSPVLDHEIAHSLFYFNINYRNEALEILKGADLTAIENYLKKEIGDYHEAVLIDEVHAWLAHDHVYLTQQGFDITPYKTTIKRLQKLYKKYL